MPSKDPQASQLSLDCRAIHNGWQLSEETRQVVIKRLTTIVNSPYTSRRDVARASAALVQIERTRLAAMELERKATEPDAPPVIVNNNVGTDTLREFVSRLSPEAQQAFLNEYGKQLLCADSEAASGE